MTTSGSATEIASIGQVSVTYAYKSWALVDVTGKSVQRKLGSVGDLGDVLRQLGVPPVEAEPLAARLWASRPHDAHFSTVRPWETFWGAQGVSPLMFVLYLFVGLVLLVLLVLLTF